MSEADFAAGRAPADRSVAPHTAAVIGLGLIGGSVARCLAGVGVRVLGCDRDTATLEAAIRSGVVADSLGTPVAPAWGGVAEADWVILAVPVDTAPALLLSLAPALGGARLVTDVGSTKSAITAAAEQLGLGPRFVGSHPFAGDHRSGWAASDAGLFRGARVYLTPCPSTGDAALHAARGLWGLCGATVELMDAAAHDRLMAWASHLPQVASSALALALADACIHPSALGRGGHDATRLAAGSPEVWTGIALENAAELAVALEALEGRLGELREALKRRDAAAIHALLAQATAWSGEGG
jgi:prephenate dehydrogenase